MDGLFPAKKRYFIPNSEKKDTSFLWAFFGPTNAGWTEGARKQSKQEVAEGINEKNTTLLRENASASAFPILHLHPLSN
jgi:uncharacterized protein YbdZ (MbtH family)